MTLSEQIQNNWKTDIQGQAQDVWSLKGTAYPAWIVKFEDSYGVAIPYSGTEAINENFANAKLCNTFIAMTGQSPVHAIVLRTGVENTEVPFSTLCAELVGPRPKGKNRLKILRNPLAWWKELLENKNIDEWIYDILGELCVFKVLIASGEDAAWLGPIRASYDIELPDRFVES